MSLPGNGIFVVQGEMAMLVTAMRRSTRWGSHSFPNEEYDVLMKTFQDLKIILNQVDDLRLLDPATYLSPFLEVIRSKETTGPVTSLALSAIHKFLSYGLIDPTHPSVPAIVEDISDAVTHARFVGTDHSSDGVVLMKILQVLRTLMLSPEGVMLTDESVCEIMLSCFRICFETRLTELLRRNAEQCLRDMTQLIFMRLPQFPPEDAASASFAAVGLSLKKRDKTAKKKSLTGIHSTNSLERNSSMTEQASAHADPETDNEKKLEKMRHHQDKNLLNEAEITIEPVDPLKTPTKKHNRHSSMDLASQNTSITQLLEKCVNKDAEPEKSDEAEKTDEQKEEVEVTDAEVIEQDGSTCTKPAEAGDASAEKEKLEEYVNHRGIRFTPQEDSLNLQPYGLVCVRELFRFLISLCNPLDSQNTSAMVHLGLSLVGTALEVGADQLAACPSLFYLVRDPLCRNLLSLLGTERISIFALDLQVSFLLFEALRFQLKFQMEAFFKKIIEIISMDTSKAIYELKEIQHLALESLAQLFRIPGYCTELYLNYDCDVYCMNVFEELTKLLSKNVISSTAYNIHSLSLEVLLTIIDAIEMGTQPKIESKSETDILNVEEEKESKYGRGGHVTLELGGMDDASVVSDHVTHDISQYFVPGRTGRHKATTNLPTEAELDNIRNMKKWVTQGTELFNQKPERGIEFLQEHGVLKTPLDPHEVAIFLRENPDLDKKMIGEYICKRSSRGEDDSESGSTVLGAFADSFDYTGLRIDQALRLYLETFRLPGEAPLIFLVMEKFAERWHSTNGEPFANTDAAFRLAYAVIMLNMDQHNHNAKKLNVPMTVDDFVKNLRGCNGSGDFDQAMLEAVYYSIKNEEMVMPAERVGPVREAYLWRVLQRRGRTAAAAYRAPAPAHPHHARLFTVVCPCAVTALSAAFERAAPPSPEEIESNNTRSSAALLALSGLERCAALVARQPADALTVDTLLLTLCKFTALQPAVAAPQHHYRAIGVTLGQSSKAQLALRRACAVAARHADCVRDAWKYLLDIVTTLFVGRLLPKSMVEVEDYLAPNGTVSLLREAARGSEAGLLSSIYSYIALGESGIRTPTPHEKSLIDIATDCVAKCNLPGLLVTETKFLQLESLQELVRAMVVAGTPPDAESLQMNPPLEDVTIFYLELLEQTLIQNRDRLLTVWDEAGPHIRRVVTWSASRCGYTLTRTLTALLRSAARLMRCDHCAAPVLQHLRLLLQLPHKPLQQHTPAISCGLYDIVKTSAQNVHSADEWRILFALLCAAGAGAWPVGVPADAQNTTSSRSEGSEDESERRPTSASSESELSQSPQQGWILVKNEAAPMVEGSPGTGWWEDEQITLRGHRTAALARCCEALALVVRDVAHVTPYNCRAAVRAVRIFARATLHDAKKSRDGRKQRASSRRRDDSSDEEIDTLDQYHLISIQLLDLMHTLHSRTAQIFKWWRDEADQGQNAEEYDLWEVAWMPLLQGIAEFCTDRRKQVSNSAIAYLQRALLVPGLSPGAGGAGGAGGAWEACFQRVLFPLLERLPRRAHIAARANTIMCKVFLQHLSALSPRASFTALWLRVIDVQASLVAAGADDALTEAALESLKNMILVMDSVRIFSNGDNYNELWYITWEKIGEFLPNLKEELFPQVKDNTTANVPAPQQPLPSMPTLVPVPTSTPSTLIPPHPLLPPHNQTSPQHTSPVFVPTLAPTSPVNLGQSPPKLAPTLVAPTPVSGMVPIRNQLYDQAGLTSSVLLQPLNEMISTPIGISIQSQMPILYPQTAPEPLQTQISPEPIKIEPNAAVTPPTLLQPTYIENIVPDKDINQSELYAEYLTNPYNEAKDLSAKEATLYDPESQTIDQTVPDSDIRNPLLSILDKQKALSTNTTPMHTRNKTQFGSTDNLRPDSGIFNFSSYFSSVNERGSEVFDTLMSTQEG
ncbi:Golgi-specific brefeldin A-resistance guanine nucleotide exchange factor 1 [Ostrinia furnacalis]|uniref:Golgi-specific brefeldin A-resistance guanine nucleotide exchange factor 1 n=1 Tax=Ostrinia furnacalis TaxID=93504 RepID=UPI0010403231|nr:Golgi-specific brefeldin A-resistance guanine nucleotide exchange factor 1 [Ostrinia furnacalis]